MHHQMIAERCPLAWNSVPALVWHSFELFEQITKAIRKRRSPAGFIFSLQALVYLAQPQPSKSSYPSCPCEFRFHRATTKGANGTRSQWVRAEPVHPALSFWLGAGDREGCG